MLFILGSAIGFYFLSVVCAAGVNYRIKNVYKLDGIPYGECFNPFKTFVVFISLIFDFALGDEFLNQFFRRYVNTYGYFGFYGWMSAKYAWRSLLLNLIVPNFIIEQYLQRYYSAQCRSCILNKKCSQSNCGCNARAQFFSPFEKCKGGQYGKIYWSSKKYEKSIDKKKFEFIKKQMLNGKFY